MKSNKFFILTLMFITLFLFTIGEAKAVCVTPTENSVTTIGGFNQTCTGTYNNATFILKSNTYLDLNDSIFIGKGAMNFISFELSSSNNISISNGRVSNHSIGLFSAGNYNVQVNNISFNNLTTGIRTQTSAKNYNISNNYFYNIATCVLFSSSSTNLTLINNNYFNNCTSYGIQGNANSYNITVINNTIINATTAIYQAGASMWNITNNTAIYDKGSNSLTGIGIYDTVGLGNHYISFNYVKNYNEGIGIKYQPSGYVYNNIVYNTNGQCIHSYLSQNINIYNNQCYNSTYNGVAIIGNNTRVYENLFVDWHGGDHSAIDCHNDLGSTICNNLTIYNNNFTSSRVSTNSQYAMFLQASANLTVYNNYIYNYANLVAGITVSGNNSYQNRIYNNTIRNITGWGLYDNSRNTTWENNTFENINSTNSIRYYGSISFGTSSIFINNTDLSKTLIFNSEVNNNSNITIIQRSSYILKADSGAGRGGNIQILNQVLAYPFNDVYNVSTASILSNNVDNYSITLTSGQQIIIGNYVHGGNGCFNTSINLTIPYYNNTPICIYAKGNTVYINFTGFYSGNPYNDLKLIQSGVVEHRNFNNVVYTLPSTFGILTGDFGESILTSPPIDPNTLAQCQSTVGAMIVSFSEIPSWLTIMMAILAASIIIGLLLVAQGELNMSFESGAFMIPVVAVLLSGFIFVIGIIILSAVC